MTESPQPTIHINLPSDAGADAGWGGPPEARLEAAAQAAFRAGPPGGPGPPGGAGAELSITFVSAASIRALNRDYHGLDDVTDVLAFPLGEDPLLGDVYISPEIARDSAREHGLDPEEEILRLVLHGVLHLLGHDHPDGESRYASPMFRLQERLLAEVRDRA
ncbi:rRNA maturation RNase YbeY [Candidatus Palauibacter sp.]|uniref:rRNA maturation RNase YbeY n=1 Tax=Candidatus Palauibacter sp. TaxID=3101350 RepID=UPI003B015D07